MKKIFTLMSIILMFAELTTAQTTSVMSYGDTLSNLIGQQGIIDKNGNKVMIGKRFSVNDNPHVALFDKNNIHQWSFYLDKNSVTANKLIQTKDGNYLAIYGTGISSQFVKFSTTGTILWYKDFSSIYTFMDVVEDSTNSNLYCLGSHNGKLILMSLDQAGSLIYSTAYSLAPVSNYFFAQSIGETHDGNLILCGVAAYLGGPNAKPVAIKTTKQGAIIWSKEFASASSSMLIDKLIESKVDHSFFGVGYRSTGVVNTFDAFSLKLDTGGNYVNNKSIEFSFQDSYYDVCEASDGGFIAIGMSKPVAVCGGNLLLTKFSQNNDTVFHKSYGTANGNGAFFFNIALASDGGYHAFGSGSFWSALKIPYDYNHIKTDALLELPCKKFNQPFSQSTLTITQANTIVSATYTPVFTATYTQKFDTLIAANGCTGEVLAIENNYTAENNFKIYPNPSSNELNVIPTDNSSYSLFIYSIDGKLIHQSLNRTYASKINTANWSEGTYIIELNFKNHQRTYQKILIDHSF